MNDREIHEWARNKMLHAYTGLLDEKEESAFKSHIDECAVCRKNWDDYIGNGISETRGEHIPSDLIARWDRATENLRGVERTLVRQHLESCPDCRQDLELSGFEPVLSYIHVLEQEEGKTTISETESDRLGIDRKPEGPGSKEETRRVAIRLFSSPQKHNRFFQGWAALATAAALILILWPALNNQPPGNSLPADAEIPWVLPRTLRGNTGAEVLMVSPGVKTILLAVRTPPGLPPETGLIITVFDPEDEQLLQTSPSWNAIKRGTIMVLLSTGESLKPGLHRVRVQAAGISESVFPSEDLHFTVIYSEP